MKTLKIVLSILVLSTALFTSCSEKEDINELDRLENFHQNYEVANNQENGNEANTDEKNLLE